MSNFLPLEKIVMNTQRAILNLQKKKKLTQMIALENLNVKIKRHLLSLTINLKQIQCKLTL